MAAPAVHAQAQIKATKDALEFFDGEELVTRYHTAGYAKPIFWPVNAPGSVPLTRNYPPPAGQAADHPHQKSAWFCHGDITPEGLLKVENKVKGVAGVDFWSESTGHGKVVVTSLGEPKNDMGGDGSIFINSNRLNNRRDNLFLRILPRFRQIRRSTPSCELLMLNSGQLASQHASVIAQNEWRMADGTKIMDERRTIHLYVMPTARLIVVDIDLHASVCPITFEDTKEGAFGIRINDVINAGKTGKGKIQNADGKIGEKDCWGQISNWCDYSGPIDGKVVGLTILADPKNVHPSCWHVRGYGLMAANPFGRDKHAKFPAMKGKNDLVRIDKGQHLQMRYGMLLHTGDAVDGMVEAYYQRFVALRGKE